MNETLAQSIYRTLKNIPQKYCVLEMSRIKKKSYNEVSSAMLYLYEKGIVERKRFSNRINGNVTWHYWIGRGRP